MEKKMFFKMSDNADLNGIILDLDGCMAWIETEEHDKNPEEAVESEYTLTPVFMTDEEYAALPEYQG